MSLAFYTYNVHSQRNGAAVKCQCCGVGPFTPQTDDNRSWVPLDRLYANAAELCVPCQDWAGEIFAKHSPPPITDVFGSDEAPARFRRLWSPMPHRE